MLSKIEVIPGFPLNLLYSLAGRLDQLAELTQSRLASIPDLGERSSIEEKLADWLFALVRHNLKRGRFWSLFDVLTQRRADCLGYAQLLMMLAKEFGLNAGMIEVIRDCRGSYVPHVVCMVCLSNGRKKLLDPWYGSADIRHRLMTARVRQRDNFVLKNLTKRGLESAEEVSGLASEQIRGIEFYILGNMFLARGLVTEAINCYDISIGLYPFNSRAWFNRSVAFENIGREENAQDDYRHAFSMKQSFPRILANIEELEQLIALDEKNLGDFDQRIYLFRRGFITGHKEPWRNIAQRLNSTSAYIRKRWNVISAKLSGRSSINP